MCENCACGGSQDIDWMLVSNDSSTDSVDKCFEASQANTFCGKMIVLGSGNCYCRGVGREDSCSRQFASTWMVYIEKTGKPVEYWTYKENACVSK